MDNSNELVLLKDKDWKSAVGGKMCKVEDFTPMSAVVKNGKVIAADKTTPYASVNLKCEGEDKEITGFISHKIDFLHLWDAFKERGIKKNEELIIVYDKRKRNIATSLLPRLTVGIYKKGFFVRVTNPNDIMHKAEWWSKEKYKSDRKIVEPILEYNSKKPE